MNKNIEKKITVITVCFNAEKTIKKTIESVIGQEYSNVEYIIIDGMSNDNTQHIIEEYTSRYQIKYLSEHDEGIYDAMNKAIKLSTGDYMIFMNAGDSFINNKVLTEFNKSIGQSEYDIYYGNVITTINDDILEVIKFDKVRMKKFNILKGDSLCHQSLFVKTNLMNENKFDLKYKICADKKFIVESYKKGKTFKYLNLNISYYDRDGISSTQTKKLQEEAKAIMYEEFPVTARLMYFAKYIKRSLLNRRK